MSRPGSTSDAAPVPAVGEPARGRAARLRVLWLLVLTALVLVLVVLSLRLGSRDVSWSDVVAVLTGPPEGFDQASIARRIPRTLLALLAGAALAVSGAVMQGVTRNPLADPGILGVNMGASVAVVIGIAYFGLSTASGYIWFAMVGAAVVAVLVYAIGSLGRGGATPLKLALAGAATAAALSSLVSAIVLPRANIAGGVQAWLLGGVGGGSYAGIRTVLPFLVVGFGICLLAARGLNSLALGDELAAGLGQRVALTRAVASLGAVALCAAVTAVAGPIGFVGLVVPHACRLLTGVDHRWLLPFSALGGAALVTVADVVGRLVAPPAEIEVSIITALIGAPLFIAIVRRRKVSAL